MEKKCVVCEVSNQKAPLIHLDYKDQSFYICPTHLPVIIGVVDGAEDFKAG